MSRSSASSSFPPQRPPTETELRILDAALELFAEKGLHGASTQEIGDAAGVGKSTLHYYFRHKDELYAQVFERAFMAMAEPLRERMRPGLGLRETLEIFLDHKVRAYHERPAMVRLWMHENMIGAPVATPLLRRVNREGDSPYAIFVDNLRAAIERGESRPVDPLQTWVTAMGASLFLPIARESMVTSLEIFHTESGKGDEPFDYERFVADRTEHLVELIVRGLAPT
ncbi:MAG: TetR/AcrR family transcriptional regulator [Acidobacteriota bacterium]